MMACMMCSCCTVGGHHLVLQGNPTYQERKKDVQSSCFFVNFCLLGSLAGDSWLIMLSVTFYTTTQRLFIPFLVCFIFSWMMAVSNVLSSSIINDLLRAFSLKWVMG
ncbi:unnamed protein product [Choristocarpus tenellus]